MMEAKLVSCNIMIILIFLLNSSLPFFTHADHHESAMDFLEPLAGTLKGNSALGVSKLKKFLSNLGYLDTNNPESESSSSSSSSTPHDDHFDDTLEQAVAHYQSFFKLPSTGGVLDAAMLAHMGQPQCGVRDVFTRNTTGHYTFFNGSPKWPAGKRRLTYSFPAGTRDDALLAIRNALNIWEEVSPFRFGYTREYGKADIKISFQYRDHGDGSAFDGSRGILAHAAPPTRGVLHFDGDEKWVNGVVAGAFDLQSVGLHELGHILGLGHSADGGAAMFPSVGDGVRKGLGKDDIDGII